KELVALDGRGADLADDDPGGEVRQPQGVVAVDAGDHGGGERGDHRIAGARDVEYLAGDGREIAITPVVEQADPFFAAGHGQEVESQRVTEPPRLGAERGLV